MANNLKQITKCRTLTLIFGGTTAGIFGFDGLQGMMFYLALITIVSFAILAGLGFKGKPYFTKMSEAATTGLFSNLLTYLLMWVMFYNLVYVL